MSTHTHANCHCCPSYEEESTSESQWMLSRRNFVAMGGMLLGGLTLSGLQSNAFAATKEESLPYAPKPRKPLIVKPVLVYDVSQPKEAESYKMWGGIQSKVEADEEIIRIKSELAVLKEDADYPIEFLDVTACTEGNSSYSFNLTDSIKKLKEHPDIAKCDTILLYAAGQQIQGIQDFGKDVVVFLRWNSGPVYRHITTISTRFLRQISDEQKLQNVFFDDVVVDHIEELNWRFRALCGLKNTREAKIVTIGNASGWAQPYGNVPEIAQKIWNFKYSDVSYDEMRKLIAEATADKKLMARAQKRAEDYLKIPGTKLESKMEFFVLGFMLDELFRLLMKKVDTNFITINSCMGAIIPASKTTACMALTTLNDDGYQAYCESDFVTIPGAMLLSNISGKPVFFGNPCFPVNGTSTWAHCACPRKMDGKTLNPVRIVTHYESDYGVAPWVEVPIGVTTTHIVPSFKSDRWVGFKGTITGVPFKPSSCRTQITVQRECSDELLAANLVGFHQITGFGDYRKEIGYALRRVGIQWDNLDRVTSKI